MASSNSFQERDAGVFKRAGYLLINSLDRLFGRYSRVGDRPFHDPEKHPEHFAWTRRLEKRWPVMREELEPILKHREQLPNFQDVTEDAATISRDDDWKTYFLYGYGAKVEENCARCPETTALVESVPGMKTAFFSILSPGKHIPEHRGPYKGVLRYHLGLKVPEQREQCRIRVADEVRHWQEGEGMIFDDTYRHEVWNDTPEERAILFMDVVRPMPALPSALNRSILALVRRSPVVRRAQENQRRWNERLEAAEGFASAPAVQPAAEGDVVASKNDSAPNDSPRRCREINATV